MFMVHHQYRPLGMDARRTMKHEHDIYEFFIAEKSI